MATLGHDSCHPGKRVLVILKNGHRLHDKFVSKHRNWIELEQAGKVEKKTIRCFMIAR